MKVKTLPVLRNSLKKVIQTINEQAALLDKVADRAVEVDPLLREKFKAFLNVKGVGAITAKWVLAEMPEIGRMNRRAAAALAGLAPFARDTGKRKRRRRIWAGRFELRKALFMAATQAARFNSVLAPFFSRLRARGKPYHVAIVAVMRKLLLHLNTLAKKVEVEFEANAQTERGAGPKRQPARLGKAAVKRVFAPNVPNSCGR